MASASSPQLPPANRREQCFFNNRISGKKFDSNGNLTLIEPCLETRLTLGHFDLP
jgi:hypothetical protein